MNRPAPAVAVERGRVAAVVLTFGRPAGAIACARSLLASTHAPFEVAVVDNGSPPEALAELESGLAAVPGVSLVRLGANRGYTGGVNAAFTHALGTHAEFVWLLADDTRVAPEAMAALVAALRAEPRAGVAAALTYYAQAPDRIWFAGGVVERTRLGRARHRGLDETDRGQFSRPGSVDYANGSSLFARRELVESIGGLDENFFMYWEDADWCARAESAGWSTWFVPGARVWHDVTPGSDARLDRARLYEARNRMLWHARHRPRRLWPVLIWTLAAVPGYVLAGRAHEGWLQLRGVLAWLGGSRGRMPDPAREQGLAARPVLANTGALVVLRGSNLAVRLGLLFLIARQVVPQEFGRLVLALSVVEVGKVLADFGMDTLAIREFAIGAAGTPRAPGETATFTATFVSCRLVSSALVQAGLVLWFLLAQSPAVAAVGLVLSFSVWTAFLQSVSLDWFQGRLRVGRALVPALVTNVAGGLVAALALARIPGLAAKAVSLPVLELLVGAVLLVALRRERDWGFGRPSTPAARKLLLGSVPIAITAFLIMLYSRLDVFVMASRLPSVDVGRYGIAYRFTEPFQIAAAVFGLSVYSRFVGWREPGAPRPGRAVLRYTAGTLAYGAVAALGLSTLAPPLIERFLPAYVGAVAPLRILAAALLFRSLNATLAGMIQAAGHFRGLALLAAWNLALVFALLLAFVPRLGVEGAALALAVGEGVNSLFQAVWVARIVRSQERASAIGR